MSRGFPPAVVQSYRRFHGVEPCQAVTKRGWVPGTMELCGQALDCVYSVTARRSDKKGRYLHLFGPGVRVYRRVTPRSKRRRRTWRSFPKHVMVLGRAASLSYVDAVTGEELLIRMTRHRWCWSASKRTLFAVGPEGVSFAVAGGRMSVSDWIRG